MTIEYLTPTMYDAPVPVIYPNPGTPVAPESWYLMDTVFGGDGAEFTAIPGDTGSHPFGHPVAASMPSVVADDGDSRYVTIPTVSDSRFGTGHVYNAPLTVSMLVRTTGAAVILRAANYIFHRAPDNGWYLQDNGKNLLRVGTGDANWHLITLVLNGVNSSARFDANAPVVNTNALDGTGVYSDTQLGNGGTGPSFDIAELMIFTSALTNTQVNAVHAAIKGRHPNLV